MEKDFFEKLEHTITTKGKEAAKKAKEVAGSAKIYNDIRVAKKDLSRLYSQVGEKYFNESMNYPEEDYIDLFNLIEKIRGDIEVMEQELEATSKSEAEDSEFEEVDRH
ncbi:MAG: hypothetical protein PHD56_01970 [Anaerostipes sp.]|nr:hypothetical protein [Anaerostipes sp.]